MQPDSETRYTAEQALQDSETRLQQVLDNTSALVFAKDQQGRYLFVNREFERISARTAAEVLGRTDDEIFPPEIATRFRHNDLRVLRERRAIEFEEIGDFGHGPQTFLSSKFPLLDSAGVVYAVCGMATDITGRKRIEEALSSAALAVSQSEEDTLYRQLTRFLATMLGIDGAFIATLDPQDPACLNMLACYIDGELRENFSYSQAGTPCETVVGQQFRIYPAHLQALFPSDVDFRRMGFESYAGHPLIDSHGQALGLIAVVSRRRLEQPAFIESVMRIFAVRVNAELERKAAEGQRLQLEARLRQAQKMEAIGQLTGGIAHDFNNLLTTIMGYVALASERQATRQDGKLGDYLVQARRSCERARDLIQQMLMFSRGQQHAAPRVVELHRLVESALPALGENLSSGVYLQVSAAPGATTVRADPLQVEQVLLNLCVNARDAMGGEGELRIDVRPVELEGAVCAGCQDSVSGHFVEMAVTDTGPGIETAVADRIFEPFYSTKETGKGTGMGLAIVHGIVHDHGGHVLLETRPGQGARFRVMWPAVPGESGTGPSPAEQVKSTPLQPDLQGSVLIVDDEESVGEFMRELLDSWGLQAAYVTRAESALELIAAAPRQFDVVITDQAMPRMTGLELVRRLYAVRPDIPVILYTGYGAGLALDESEAARPCAVLRKPVDPARLATVLAQCLRKGSAARSAA